MLPAIYNDFLGQGRVPFAERAQILSIRHQGKQLLKSGQFMLNIIGPTRRTFNFSDCGSGTGFFPAMTWFAARAGQPELMWFETELLERELASIRDSKGRQQGDRYFPLVLVWAQAGLERKEPASLNWLGQGQNPLAVFRTSWTDPNAVFLAIKAGAPSASHAHMDIGSFLLDAVGMRWSRDLGAQDYNELEQRGVDLWNFRQGSERWLSVRRFKARRWTFKLDRSARETHAPSLMRA